MSLAVKPGLNNQLSGTRSSLGRSSISSAIKASSSSDTDGAKSIAEEIVSSQEESANDRTVYSSTALDNQRLSYSLRSYNQSSSSSTGSSSGSSKSSPGSSNSAGTSSSNGAESSKTTNDNINPNTKNNAEANQKAPDLPTLPQKTTDQTDPLVPNPDNVPLTQSEFDVIRYTNALREQAGKPPLIVKQNLMDTAQLSSDRMKSQSRMVHGLTSGWRGENIAMGQNSAREVANAWRNSSGHYANMMGNFKYIGVGDTTEKQGSNYWTQQFG